MADLVVGEFDPVVEVWSLGLGDELLPIAAHLGIQL